MCPENINDTIAMILLVIMNHCKPLQTISHDKPLLAITHIGHY